MGFTTGFMGGLTLTYSILYMSLYIHRQNRAFQRTLLSQQSRLLLSSVEETPSPYEELAPPAYRVSSPGLTEQLKEGWNREVAKLVHNVQDTDWEEVRIKWEKRAGHVWGNVRGSDVGQEVEKNVRDSVEKVKDGMGDGMERVREGVKDGMDKVKERSIDGVQKVKEGAIIGVQKVKEGAIDGVQKVKEGMIDGVEKVKENLDRAKENVVGAKDELKVEAKEALGQKRLLEL